MGKRTGSKAPKSPPASDETQWAAYFGPAFFLPHVTGGPSERKPTRAPVVELTSYGPLCDFEALSGGTCVVPWHHVLIVVEDFDA